LSILPLDWGTIVPLYFMPETPVVVVSPSRELDFAQHLAMGSVLAEAVVATHKRVGLIASCDWAHTHTAKGPYGYHRAAKELDMQVLSLVQANNLEAMAEFPLDWVEQAKPDGIWQALILAGAIPHRDRKIELVSYELPTYFGLLCAGVRGA
jgi:aromatic ring-opening dioxygenase LigB subunit